MAIVKAEGVVMRTMKIGETSKLVTLYSREQGILKLNAKGSRTAKSRFGAALEPSTMIQAVYYFKQTREIQFLSQTSILEVFSNLQTELEKLGYASACYELITRTQLGDDPSPKLYPILIDTLRAMNSGNEPQVIFWGFQMKLLGVLGIAPNLRRCLNCNHAQQAQIQRSLYFQIARGGFFCENCFSLGGTLKLNHETLSLLSSFQSYPAQKLLRHTFSESAIKEIESFYRAYYGYHLSEIRGLESLKFVKEIKGSL